MDPILQVDRLSISFTQYGRGLRRRTLPVIRDLSLSLLPGQVTAVVGASGSGKSLLTHAILGLLPYNSRTEGTILYRGEPLIRRRVRFPQRPHPGRCPLLGRVARPGALHPVSGAHVPLCVGVRL